MMQQVSFEFIAGDPVNIKGISKRGVVVMSAFDGAVQYQVMTEDGVLVWLSAYVLEEVS